MKLERISDAQLLWSLDKEDFIKNQLNINDFLTGTQKARSLFQEAMKQAARDCMFESEGYLLHCQLQEVSEEVVTFSITRLQPWKSTTGYVPECSGFCGASGSGNRGFQTAP